MDWLLSKREKSVARNAQLAVKNMHEQMDKQGKRIAELEGLVTGMNVICTKALDQEIQRLETKKKDLIEELEKTEKLLVTKKTEREATKDSVQKVLLACAADRPKQVVSKLKKHSFSGSPKLNQLSERNHVDSDSPMGIPDDASDIIASTVDGNEDPLEEQYLEEIEMLAAVRETMSGSNLLFVLHRSNADDIVMYMPSENPTEVVSISKLIDPSDKSSMGVLSSFDFILGLGSKIVPNHERDLPEVVELPIPCTYEGSAPVAELLNTGYFERTSLGVEESEHSIEMHLPYIARVMSGNSKFQVVPIMVDALDNDQLNIIANQLVKYLGVVGNIFIVSSDFCHWGRRFRYQPYDESKGEICQFITELDGEGIQMIENQNRDAFEHYLIRTNNTICGRYPILLLLAVIEKSTFTCKTKFVKYAQSSSVTDKSDSSVSYASAIIELEE